MNNKRHVISLLMENKAGALSRVVGLFSARGFNIENLNVAPTQDETVSRLTLVTYCDEKLIEQINKQLNKLIEVINREEKICNYMDIPLQHISDNILESMKRHSTEKSIRTTLNKLREKIPDMRIRTT